MPILTCFECGAISPKKSMDDLVQMGWNRAKGKIDEKPYDISLCPLDSSISNFSALLIRELQKLQKSKEKEGKGGDKR